MSDIERERFRRESVTPTLSPRPSLGTSAFVGSVTTTSPTVMHYLELQPVIITGTEVEGGTGIITSEVTQQVPALYLGPTNAVTGDFLVADRVNWRWVVEKGGSGGGGTFGPNLPCVCGTTNIANTLHLTTNDPTKNGGAFPDATLTYSLIYPCGFSIPTYRSASFTRPGFPGTACYVLVCGFGGYFLGLSTDDTPCPGVAQISKLSSTGPTTCNPFLATMVLNPAQWDASQFFTIVS